MWKTSEFFICSTSQFPTQQYAAQYAGYTGYNDARADQSLKMTGRGPSSDWGNFPEFDGKPILASSVQFSQSTLSKIMKLSENEERKD